MLKKFLMSGIGLLGLVAASGPVRAAPVSPLAITGPVATVASELGGVDKVQYRRRYHRPPPRRHYHGYRR